MKRFRTPLIIFIFALLPLLVFYWRGYIELYRRFDAADVRVNGIPAGYVHRGRISSIVTRTDVPDNHSYRIWPTATEILIFDCHNWIAPAQRFFFQGKVSAPCIYGASGSASHLPMAPVTVGTIKDGVLSFQTRDGKTTSLKVPW